MNEKPEALRLIEHMDDNYADDWDGIAIRAELRRQHAEIERLKAERDEAVRAEREACAKVCEGMARPVGDEMMSDAQWIVSSCAAAIRARGQEVPR